jgi:LCP family protein required for cell wall assembly
VDQRRTGRATPSRSSGTAERGTTERGTTERVTTERGRTERAAPPRSTPPRAAYARTAAPPARTAGRPARRPAPAPAGRGPLPPERGPATSRWGRARRRLRTAVIIASTLVLTLTGTAWGLYRDVTAGITTTDVIAGGGDGGDLNILLVGVDSRTDAQGRPLAPEVQRMLNSGADTGVLNADTIILLHVPEGGGAATAFSIPRDAYVNIPGYRRDKINAAYPATKALASERLAREGVRASARRDADAAQEGRSTLIRTVEDLTGQSVDHYAEINLLGFHNLTTAIGGVDVCLRAPVDEALSGARFAAGPQTISGTDALAFVRQRHGLPDGDLSRIRRQQVFLAAVADKILAGGTLTDPARLGALIEVAQQSIVIDAGWDLLAFAQQAADIAAGDMQFMTIPTTGRETNARGDVLLVEPSAVSEFIETRVAEQAAAAEAAAASARVAAAVPPPPVDLVTSRYVTDVSNGSDIGGLAGSVAAHLQGLGFAPGVVDNAEATGASVVRYTDPDRDAAHAVAEQLGGIDVESDGTVARGHLQIVLGADFDPAVVPTPAEEPAAAATGDAAPEPSEPITAAGVPCID